MAITPERNRKLAFVGPCFMSGKGLITKSKALAKLQKPEAMNDSNITVAVLKDSTSQAFAETSAAKAKIVKMLKDTGLLRIIHTRWFKNGSWMKELP